MMDNPPEYPPNNAAELAARSLEQGDPTGWFEALYAHADASGRGVPWAQMAPHPALVRWLDAQPDPGGRALVVGCGLGDDAEAAAQHGYDVTAFDVAGSAIELCKRRFPASSVDYHTADLFNPQESWHQAFDLVIECTTIQSLPPQWHEKAIRHTADFAAPGGQVFALTTVSSPQLEPSGPPWPVAVTALDAFEEAGLHRQQITERRILGWASVWQVQAVYRRPE